VHTFVTTRVDYCNYLLAGAAKTTTDALQHVMNSAALVVTTSRYLQYAEVRPVTQVRRHDLHWPDVTDRIKYRQCVNVYRNAAYTTWHHSICLISARWLQKFLDDNIFALLTMEGQQHTSRFKVTTFERRSFACAAPSTWNSLPADSLKGTVSFSETVEDFFFPPTKR